MKSLVGSYLIFFQKVNNRVLKNGAHIHLNRSVNFEFRFLRSDRLWRTFCSVVALTSTQHQNSSNIIFFISSKFSRRSLVVFLSNLDPPVNYLFGWCFLCSLAMLEILPKSLVLCISSLLKRPSLFLVQNSMT